MKLNFKKINLAIAILATSGLCFSQTTITFRPDASDSSDVFLDSYSPDTGYASATEIMSEAWTCNGVSCNFRSLIKFDLSSIPQNATVINATIALYAHPNQINGNISLGPTYGSANLSYLGKVTSPWNANTVTWNTLPSITSLDRASLPTSTNNHQDYLINVKNIVQGMIGNPSTNYGFLLHLDNETPYNCLIFCSSEFADSTKRPQLNVTYTTQGLIVLL